MSTASDLSLQLKETANKWHPLSSAQNNIWLSQCLSPALSRNIGAYALVKGTIDLNALSQAVHTVVEETPALKIQYAMEGKYLHQRINSETEGILQTVDLSHSMNPHQNAQKDIYKDMAYPRKAEEGELFNFTVFLLNKEQSVFYIRCHHISLDGYGLSLVSRRITELYNSFIKGDDPKPLEKILPFNYATEQDHDYRRSKRYSADKNFWNEYMNQHSDFYWLASTKTDSADSDALLNMSYTLFRDFKSKECFKDIRISHFLIAAAAFHFRLFSGKDKLNFTLPISNRSKSELNTVSMKANILPLFLTVPKDLAFTEVIENVSKEIKMILKHGEYLGEDIFRKSGLRSTYDFGPAVNIIYLNFGQLNECQTHWHVLSFDSEENMNIRLFDPGDGNGLQITFSDGTKNHSEDELKLHELAFKRLLEELAENPRLTIDKISPHWSESNKAILNNSFYSRRFRPEAAGYIIWDRTAEELFAEVQALRFDPLRVNPQHLPKVMLPGGQAIVTYIDILNTQSEKVPGTLLHITENCWQLSTGNRDIVVSLADFNGSAFNAKELAAKLFLKPNDVLPRLAAEQIKELAALYRSLIPDQDFWIDRLKRFYTPELPCSRNKLTSEFRQTTDLHYPETLISLTDKNRAETLLTAWLIYLARVTDESDYQIAWVYDKSKYDNPFATLCLSSTAPMKVVINHDFTFADICKTVKNECDQLIKRQSFSYELSARYPKLRKNGNILDSRRWNCAVHWIEKPSESETDNLDHAAAGKQLTLRLNIHDGSFRWVYDASLFDSEQINNMSEHILTLAANALDPAKYSVPVSQIDMLSDFDRKKILIEWNKTEKTIPQDLCIHEFFEKQAAKSPESTALTFQDKSLSYAELNSKANKLAHMLLNEGIKPDDRVALCFERGAEMIVSVLAVLKAGGAYVPIDPVYPSERIFFMLEDSRPVAVLVHNSTQALVNKSGISVINTDKLEEGKWNTRNPQREKIGLQPHNLAYIIYTSGSTGTPKGVMVEHRQVVRLFTSTDELYGFNEKDTWSLFHSIAFDFSVWELWGALAYGGRLLIIPQETARSASEFHKLAVQEEVSVLNQTPSAFSAFMEAQRQSGSKTKLRYVIFGGEALDPSMLKTWYKYHPDPQPALVNMYGITETTVHVTAQVLNKDDSTLSKSIIGRRISDLRIYLLDKYGLPVPIGVTGELYIGGAGVARGYLNRPELTAERFIPDPFGGEENALVYRTGDTARYLPDGTLEYLGRNDHQVKIRGFRIELGEIETRLLSHPSVREAAVLAREDEPGNKRLVGYVVASDHPSLNESLRSWLCETLPDYMVPAAIVRLESMPLTSNGKLNNKALPQPCGDSYVRESYQAPRGETEIMLASLWSELVGVKNISRNDNFFALGGNSILAVNLVSRAKKIGLPLTLSKVMHAPELYKQTLSLDHGVNFAEARAIPVRTTGKQLPVFFLPDGGTDHAYVFEMAREMPEDFPIYVLPWPGDGNKSFNSIDQVVSILGKIVQSIQPKGPYRLVGYSLGGALGYALAEHLISEGKEISFLGSIDGAHPSYFDISSYSYDSNFFAFVAKHIGWEASQKIIALSKSGRNFSTKELASESMRLGINMSADEIKEKITIYKQIKSYQTLVVNYSPKTLPVEMYQFYSRDFAKSAINIISKYQSHTTNEQEKIIDLMNRIKNISVNRGWEDVMPDNSIHAIEVPGDHTTIMTNAENRAKLTRCLYEALQNSVRSIKSEAISELT